MKPNTMRWAGLLIWAVAMPIVLPGQGRIVLNGGRVNITNNAVVVVANSNRNAITRTANGGHFISEGADNRIRWNIGTATGGAYVIPWGTAAGTYIPVSFTPSGASGTGGFFYFATYQTTAQNSASLPAGITHFNNAAGADASLIAVDRFWRIQSQAYTAAPAMANVILTYADAEFATPNKTTTENKLTARRWNAAQTTWQDYVTGGTVNTTANTVTIASLPAAQLYPWWSVQYPGASYHWIATATANYNTAANWSATAGGTGGLGVPGAGDAVFFDAVRNGSATINTAVDVGSWTVASGYTGTISQGANTINIDGDAAFSSGTFAGGTGAATITGNLTVAATNFTAPAGTLDVKRNVTITGGTFAHNNGRIRFSGTAGTQTLSAAAVTFYNMDVTNTSGSPGMILESNSLLAGVLTLGTNVTVDPDGLANNRVLTLLSTADSPTRDAAIGILPAGASINGRVTVQRFMTIEGTSGGRIYRYISSPVSNATVADIQNEIPVTGSFTGTSKCTGCTNTVQSMFEYDETVTTDTNKSGVADYDDGYIDFPKNANTEVLQPGKGYAIYVRGNIIPSALWDVRGHINAGNNTPVTMPVSYTASGVGTNDGWNLVGNPYPSTIDWNAAAGWTKTNINGAIYTRDNAAGSGQYATWNGVVGTNGGSRYIATGQAFWVKASAAAPALRANENVKAPGTQTTFFRERAPEDLLRITLSQGAARDEAVIHLRADATNDFDENADAAKLPNAGFNLSTRLAGTQYLAINSLDQSQCTHTVSLSVDNVTAGSYNLSFEGLESFADGAQITLADAFTGTTVDLNSATNYAFSVTADAASFGSARFALTVARQAAPMDFAVATPAICPDADGSIMLNNASQQNVYTVFMNDQLITTQDGADGNMSITIPAQQLSVGNNPVVVRATPAGACGGAVDKTSTLVVERRVTPQVTNAKLVCREGQATLSAAGAASGQTYRWYARADDDHALASGQTFITPVLVKEATYYVSILTSAGCESDRVPVVAGVVQYADPQITIAGDSLYTAAAGPKQWYLDGTLLSADTLAWIKPRQSGVYGLSVQVQTCLAHAVVTYTIPKIITGVPEATAATLQVFPNPVRGYLYFESADATLRQVTIQNTSGQTVGHIKLQQGAGKFDMSPLASGLYLIQIQSHGAQQELKVIKE